MSVKDVLPLVLEFVIPGVGGTIFTAIDKLWGLCSEMKESKGMCERVMARVQLICDELKRIEDEHMLRDNNVLPLYGQAIANFMDFLKKHARKHLLPRLAATRSVAEEIQSFHEELDFLFKLLNLVHIAEMSAWRTEMKKDQETQRALLEELVTTTHFIRSELKGNELVEALSNLKYEIQYHGPGNGEEHVKLMNDTLKDVMRTSKAHVPKIPTWFIPSDDVKCPDEYFDMGSYGTVHRGTWSHAKVVIKRLLMESDAAQKTFLTETELWSTFEHPHILKLFGANHVSTPVFFVCEDATGGNFVEYFKDPDNKHHMWQLFFEAACGLEFLHKRGVVHGDLKCNNLLVGADGKAKICDFGFSFIRTASVGLSMKPQTDATRWKALETLEGVTGVSPPHESDVYSLGMCIIEAVTGDPPWWGCDDDDDDSIIENLMSGESHPRPADGFTDKQWDLVAHMTAIEMSDRMVLKDAIGMLQKFAIEEAREEARVNSLRHDRLCPECQFEVPDKHAFCGRCGERLGTLRKAASAHRAVAKAASAQQIPTTDMPHAPPVAKSASADHILRNNTTTAHDAAKPLVEKMSNMDISQYGTKPAPAAKMSSKTHYVTKPAAVEDATHKNIASSVAAPALDEDALKENIAPAQHVAAPAHVKVTSSNDSEPAKLPPPYPMKRHKAYLHGIGAKKV